LTHLLRCIKADYYERWEAKWNTIPHDLKRHSYVGDWKKKPIDDRVICSTVTQLRIGHGHFASYLHRMGFETTIAAFLALLALGKSPNTFFSSAHATPRLAL
jgi:hypothetical protein